MNYGLPEGISLGVALGVLIPMGVVTVLLRVVPFFFVKSMRDNPLLESLGRMMPVGVMVILVVYALADLDGPLWAGLAGVAATLGLHWWRRSLALSIFGGLAFYVALVNLVV